MGVFGADGAILLISLNEEAAFNALLVQSWNAQLGVHCQTLRKDLWGHLRINVNIYAMPSSGEVAFMTSQNVLSVSECCRCPQVSQQVTTLFIKGDNPSA